VATSSPLPPTDPPLDYGRSFGPAKPAPRFWADTVPFLARIVLGAIFVWMGYKKAANPIMFLKQIHEYHMVPDSLYVILNAMAAALPWIEIVCGALLILGIATRGSSLLLALMLVVFSAVILLRAMGIYNAGGIGFCAIKFDCGCGSGEQFICHKLPENMGLLLLSLIALFARSRRFSLRRNLIPFGSSPWRIEGY